MLNDLLLFLKELGQNNNREWFEKNRQRFETVKGTFTKLVEDIITGLGKSDPDIRALEAKNCIFRQYRDVRFSLDKTPYKIHIGAYMNKGGKKINTAGYYLHIEPGKSLIAGGLYQPDSHQLRNVRQEIDYNLEEWEKLIGNKSFRAVFPNGISREDSLKRPPRGYEADNPSLKFMLLKSFVFQKPLADEELVALKDEKPLIKTFTSLTPVINFLNRAGDL